MLDIITDNKWKFFQYSDEVPKKVLQDYDHLDKEENLDGWFKYRKRWYHQSDFLSLHNKVHCPESPFPKKWDGYLNDSAFSGVLIKLSDDGEMYQVGTFISMG